MFVVVGLALALRLSDLALKPLHHDEGVNAWFVLKLYWWGSYQYQPSDYHGPLLYYANLVAFWLLGPSETSLRLSTALAGALLPLALLPARRLAGDAALLVAGLLLAVAPGLVYFSRTSIHEIHLVFFTALWAACLARFAERPGLGWAAGAALSAAGCFATKETAIITAACLATGAGLCWLLGRPAPAGQPDLFGGRSRREAVTAWARGSRRGAVLGALCFALPTVVLFTSFFSYEAGLAGLVEAFLTWFEYGTTGRNQTKPFGYIWRVMGDTGGWVGWLALAPGLWALIVRDRLGIALLGWVLSALLVYSWIPYKTPWCVLEIDLPLFLLVGWGAGCAWRYACDASRRAPARGVALAAVVLCLAPVPQLARESLRDNRERYDDFRRRFVFHQTFAEFTELPRDLLGAMATGAGSDDRGLRALDWGLEFPLSWYLLTRGWALGRYVVVDRPPSADQLRWAQLIVTDDTHVEAVAELLETSPEPWHRERYYHRPGRYAFVFYRQPVWDAFQAAGGRAATPWPRPPQRPLPAPPQRRSQRKSGTSGSPTSG